MRTSLFEDVYSHFPAQPLLLPSPVSVLIILFVCFLVCCLFPPGDELQEGTTTAASFTDESPVSNTAPDT